MFVTHRQFKERIDYLEGELSALNNKYQSLYYDYKRLLRKLGLREVVVPEKTLLRAEGDLNE